MDATILGMDPINFALTVISVLGVLFSILAFVHHFDPSSGQWLFAAEGMDQARSYLEHISPILSIHHQHRLRQHVNRMEHELASLMLGTMPKSNDTLQKLKGWTKTWRLLWLSKEIHTFNVTLRMISKQKERVEHAKHEETTMDPFELEALVEASIERLIMSLPIRTSTRQKADAEANSSGFMSNIRVHLPYSDIQDSFPSTGDACDLPSSHIRYPLQFLDSVTSTLSSGSRESLPMDGCSGQDPTKPSISYPDLPLKPPRLHLSTVRKLSCNLQ